MYHRIKFGGSLINGLSPLHLLEMASTDNNDDPSGNITRSGLLVRSYKRYMPIAMDTYNDIVDYIDKDDKKRSNVSSFIEQELDKLKNNLLK